MTRGKSSRVPSIDDVRSRFERWRQTRQGKVPMPVKTAFPQGEIRGRFRPATKTGENVPGGPVRSCFNERSADAGRCRTGRCESM